ncbi:MAG: sulfotransferase [Planctomycetota bacterium]
MLSGYDDIVLHVGVPRAASTFLQREVFPKLGAVTTLLGRSTGDERFCRKHLLIQRNFSGADFEKTVDGTTHQASPFNRRLIISQEGLCAMFRTRVACNTIWGEYLPANVYVDELRAVTIERLQHLLPRARVIVVVRDPVARLTSHYASSAGSERSRDALLAASPTDYFDGVGRLRTGYDQSAIVASLVDAFGKDRVLVVPFDWLTCRFDEFMRTVTAFIGVDARGLTFNRAPVNTSADSMRHVVEKRLSRWLLRRLPSRIRPLANGLMVRPWVRLTVPDKPCHPAPDSPIWSLAAADSGFLASMVSFRTDWIPAD